MPPVSSPFVGDASLFVEQLRAAVTALCTQYLRKALTPAALVSALTALKRGVPKHCSDTLFRLSMLFKRVEKTCGMHLCGLWNEVREGVLTVGFLEVFCCCR